ncbi:hypothetical protein GCK72_009343 [Caenorhabditis remanei]|uniref:F-box associated domain-containing protein n=1 Tax=Caenorhabditis remanei TaxID=31234 RepID=A0A6A5H2A0_CAERE|nr:hypothetical protein GCK72_009343 [Caenorhabditis remanei]KAF1761089.1 hypothetical protein GCK72_009343 [Caenorhabditis remanei]
MPDESETDVDSNSFQFDIFEDFLEEIEKEKLENQHRKSPEQMFRSLTDFIGGFKNWHLLNDDCKMEVVKFLDYKSRCRLGICSKSDYEIVNKTPIQVYSVQIIDNDSNHFFFSYDDFDTVTVRFQFYPKSTKEYELVFSQLGEDTQIRWLKFHLKKYPEARSLILKSCNYQEEAVKFAERIMKKGHFELEKLSVSTKKYPIENSCIKFLPRCKELQIGIDDVELIKWWLQRIPERIKLLVVYFIDDGSVELTIPSEYLDAPQITSSLRLGFGDPATFSDEQFLNLKNKSISFNAITVSDDAINQFIKMWINGNGIEDFREANLGSLEKRDEATILRGIDVRPWDEDFQREADAFIDDFKRVCGGGRCYQVTNRVDPYESLTLQFSDLGLYIYASGKKIIHNGKPCTRYSIPLLFF